MKLKARLMLFTAAAALSANTAFAAINPETLAASYLAEGYTYVEVKVGPTQTKLEAIKGDRKVEVVYDNASGAVVESEFDDADDDYEGRTGVEIEAVAGDFSDNETDDDGDDQDGDDQDGDDGDGDDRDDDQDGDDDEGRDDDSKDDDDDDNDDDEGADGHDGDKGDDDSED